MKIHVIRAKIDALEDIKTKCYGIQIGSSFEGIVEIRDVDKELDRLYLKLKELEDETEGVD
jgi:hypothetical protein